MNQYQIETPEAELARFWSKVGQPVDMGYKTPCRLWMASLRSGYGRFCAKGKMVYAHRYIYTKTKGALPIGFQPDHLCKVRACANPDHLEAVTSRVNTLRGIGPTAQNARKTHCVRGHPLSGNNVWIRPSKYGRYCRTCMRDHRRMTDKKRNWKLIKAARRARRKTA